MRQRGKAERKRDTEQRDKVRQSWETKRDGAVRQQDRAERQSETNQRDNARQSRKTK